MRGACFLLQQCFTGPENIAGTHGDHHITGADNPPQHLSDLRKGLAVDCIGNLIDQIVGRNTDGILLTGSVDLSHQQHIGLCQFPDKIREQRMGSGVSMGLECQHQTSAGHGCPDGGNGGKHLIRMVGIVVIDIRAVELALVLHAASGAMEGSEALGDCPAFNAQHPGAASGSQRIESIVLAQNAHIQMAIELAVTDHIKMLPVGTDVTGGDPVALIEAESNVVDAGHRFHGVNIVTVGEHTAGSQLLLRDNLVPMVAGKHVLILAASVTTGYTALGAIQAVDYYGGKVVGVASIFATTDQVGGYKVRSCFNPNNLPDYSSYLAHECPQCKAGVKLDALINGHGYSKL